MTPAHLILCPLKKEWTSTEEAVVKLGLEKSRKQSQGRWHIEIPAWRAAVCVGGHGKAQMALQTQYWLDRFPSIENVIVIGAAGGLTEAAPVGGVLSVQKIIEHDYKEGFVSNPTLPEFFTQNSQWTQSSLHPSLIEGTLASGDEDIVDRDRARHLHASTGAIAVAWESAGAVRAAKFNSRPYFEFRGITDSASANASQDFNTHLPQCMKSLVKVLDGFLRK